MFTNWKTTSAGILAIAGAVTHLSFAIKNHTVTPDEILADITGALVGVGLLFAKDNNVTGGTVDNGKRVS